MIIVPGEEGGIAGINGLVTLHELSVLCINKANRRTEVTAVRTEYDSLFFGGRWEPSAGMDRLAVVSPHTGRVIGSTPVAVEADVDRAVALARQAFDASPWPNLDPGERMDAVARLLGAYSERTAEMTEVVIAEMGSPRWFAELAQGPGGAAMLSTFLDAARSFDWEVAGVGHNAGAVVRREPVGVVGAITPWNVPQLVIMPKLAPALLAGCTVVVKAAPESPLDALLLAEIVAQADLPPGVVSILVGGRAAGEHLVRHPDVDKIAFTGSSAVGRRIAGICGERLARCSLELGGKSAAIILEDADLSRTAAGLKFASFLNNGQACVAQSRVLVPRHRYDQTVDALAAMVEEIVVGDPGDPSTYIGPLVSRRQQERVIGYVEAAAEGGARTVVGGTGRPEGLDAGWYVAPTLLADVDNSMPVAREEIFGPVICVIPYDGEDDAVRIANDSPFGLAGSVWTKDRVHGRALANRMRTGMVGINGFAPDLWSPFGGYKESGIGREYGPVGLSAYLEYKSIYSTV
ncbi:MAG TPA: aldehyde dehydrogenase [Acidimicrobiales bacterium]|nr:aldehyde dehydrogenase [Acidimicrobiales bacterium]